MSALQHPCRLHGLGQVGNDVLGVLQTDAEPEEALLIDGGVVGQLVAVPVVVDDQGLNIAQRHGVSHQLQRVQELLVLLLVALQVEGDHTGVLPVHQLLRPLMLGMALQAGIPHEAGSGAGLQKLRYLHGHGAVLLHPQRHGGKAAGDQPCVEGAEDAAVVHHGQFLDLVDERRAAQHTAAQRVTVAVDVLGHAVDLQIRAVAQGPDADGAGKGSVHAQQRAGLVCDVRDGVDVADAGGGIARCLHMDELGVGTDSGADSLRVGGIQQCHLHAVLLGQILPKQQVRGAVTHLGDDGVVAGVQRGGKHGGQRRHAAGEHRAVLRAGQGAQLVLQHHLVGIAVALINVAVDAAPVHRRAVGGDAVVGGHIDRLVNGAEAVVLPSAAVYGGGVDVQLSFHGDALLSIIIRRRRPHRSCCLHCSAGG